MNQTHRVVVAFHSFSDNHETSDVWNFDTRQRAEDFLAGVVRGYRESSLDWTVREGDGWFTATIVGLGVRGYSAPGVLVRGDTVAKWEGN